MALRGDGEEAIGVTDTHDGDTIAGWRDEPPKAARPELPRAFPVQGWARYEFVAFLGEGGMGQVYKAVDRQLKRAVALKFLHERNPDLVARFMREAEAQARIDHEHICKIYEAGEVDGQPYIAMQFIDGPTLKTAERDMTMREKIAVLRDAALAVEAAHHHGVIHRDVKPDNILVERQPGGGWRPFVLDFGLAREVESSGMTATGFVVGTAAYMPPEQARGESYRVDRRSDVYSLGATLYELLAGEPPFSGSAVDILVRVLQEEPRRPRRSDRTIPADLEIIALKCLEKEPQRRYDTAQAFADDLGRYLDGEPILARGASVAYRVRKKIRKNRALSAVVAVAALLVAAIAAWGLRTQWQARERAALAQAFGADVEKMDSILRYAHMLPLHDTRREQGIVRSRMGSIQKRMAREGRLARGPGRYALGRGYLALGELEPSLSQLQSAWNAGYRTPETAFALGSVLGELYERERNEAESISNRELRKIRLREIERRYRAPALEYLRASSSRVFGEAPEYLEARIAFYSGSDDVALAKARQAIARVPWLYEARVLEGEIFGARGNARRESGEAAAARVAYGRAEAAFRGAIAMAASDPRAYEGLCALRADVAALEVFGKGGDLSGGIASDLVPCRQAVESDPSRALAHVKMSWLERLSAEYASHHGGDPVPALERAIGHANDALELDAAAAEAWLHLGTAEQLIAASEVSRSADPRPRLARAVAAYRQAIRLRPTDAFAYNNLGNTYGVQSDWERDQGIDPRSTLAVASQAYGSAISVAPTFAYAYNNRGIAYKDRGIWEREHGLDPRESLRLSVEDYRKATSLNPEYPYGFNNMGHSYWELAEDSFERGEDPGPWLDKAEVALAKSKALKPDYATPESNLGSVHLLAAEWARARGQDPSSELSEADRHFSASLAINPKSGDWTELAQVRLEQAAAQRSAGRSGERRLADARSLLEKALAGDTGGSRARRLLAEVEIERAREFVAAGRSPEAALAAAAAAIEKAAGPSRSAHMLDLTRARMLCVRAEWLSRAGKPAQAEIEQGVVAARRAFAGNARLAEARAIEGVLFRLAGKPEESARCLRDARQINPMVKIEDY